MAGAERSPRRVLVLGRGGSGKSALARALGARLGLPVVELDAAFWTDPALRPLGAAEWGRRQAALVAGQRWVLDGDLGRYDALAPRLARADLVVLLDLPLPLCLWRAARRGRERADFWWWALTWGAVWRRRHVAAARAAGVPVVRLRSRRAVARWLAALPAPPPAR